MTKKVFVTRRLPQEALDKLEHHFDCEINPEDRVLSSEEIARGAQNCQGLLCLLTDTIDATLMDQWPELEVISNYAVGYNNIDVEEATRRGILVTNTPGVLTETTADMAFALILASARRMGEGERYLRAGKFKGWGPMTLLGREVSGKKLGILGMGRIGAATARRGALGFQMEVLYHNRKRREEVEREFAARYCPDPRSLFEESDFISVHLPLTEETHHFVNEERLNLMKPTACLINTARGPVVDEEALARALKEKKIFAAGLDVYEEEPQVHPDLLEVENVVLLPHLGSATTETRTEMAHMAVDNLVAALENRRPPSLVNNQVWEDR